MKKAGGYIVGFIALLSVVLFYAVIIGALLAMLYVFIKLVLPIIWLICAVFLGVFFPFWVNR
jgi:hypothetical protein